MCVFSQQRGRSVSHVGAEGSDSPWSSPEHHELAGSLHQRRSTLYSILIWIKSRLYSKTDPVCLSRSCLPDHWVLSSWRPCELPAEEQTHLSAERHKHQEVRNVCVLYDALSLFLTLCVLSEFSRPAVIVMEATWTWIKTTFSTLPCSSSATLTSNPPCTRLRTHHQVMTAPHHVVHMSKPHCWNGVFGVASCSWRSLPFCTTVSSCV